MAVCEERLRLGRQRRLSFLNLLNGVPHEISAAGLLISVEQDKRNVEFVAKKICEYRHRRCLRPHPDQGMLPPIPCDNDIEILTHRDALRWTLQWITDETLSTDLLLPDLRTHSIDRVQDGIEAARAVRSRVREVR